MGQNKNIEKRKKNQLNQYQENRKNTIKQTTNIQNMKNEEYKYDENMMSGKRDVVFKKGFLQKQGKKFKHFHERYFILWSNGLMNYYSKEHTLFANYQEKSKQLTVKNTDKQSIEDSGDDEEKQQKQQKNKNKKFKKHMKRKSTLHKLGLKSDVIKPKGTIDINELIETQFL